jgi:predicted transcriptional regulator
MEDISELMFILASDDRLALLSGISDQKQRLTSLSRVIKSSPQECSRHLARLSDAGFVKKDSAGFYETTTLGKAVQCIFPSIQFLLKHKNSFLTHDLSLLPKTFIERIGELSEGQYINHLSQVLSHIKKTISEARQYIWLISDQPIVPGASVGKSFPSRAMAARFVFEQIVDQKEFIEAKPLLPERLEIRTTPDIKIAMAINETTAGVCFPALNGELDFNGGFVGKDPQFRAWCGDLFEHYWMNSTRLLLP